MFVLLLFWMAGHFPLQSRLCYVYYEDVDLQTPASIRQLNRVQVPHHLFLPGLSQWDLSHMARDQET